MADVIAKLRWVVEEAQCDCPICETAKEAIAEIERLRQAIWDACAILGMDTDGNATPRHLIHPPLHELIISEAHRARQDYDDLLEELEIQHG